jgi:hypothetical protein
VRFESAKDQPSYVNIEKKAHYEPTIRPRAVTNYKVENIEVIGLDVVLAHVAQFKFFTRISVM